MDNDHKDQQMANNRKILDSIGNDEANKGHIFKRAWKRMRAMQIVGTLLKRARQDEQKALTNAELYLDDWAFHHGGPITKGNVKEAVADCVDRATSLHRAKQHAAEEKEFRTMQGPLGDSFDDEPMGDLPGEDEFRQSVLRYNKDHGL
jgi:hypothetical protein